MNRRRVLACAGIALSTPLAGCSSDIISNSDPSSSPSDTPFPVQTPPEGGCEPSTRRRPTPDSSRAKQFPALPNPITPSAARTFATTFERAYRYNFYLPRNEDIEIDLKVPDWSVSETKTGYTLGLNMHVQFDNTKTRTGTASPYPSGGFRASAWYYLTERFALRREMTEEIEKGDTPTLAGAETVACDTAER